MLRRLLHVKFNRFEEEDKTTPLMLFSPSLSVFLEPIIIVV